MKTDMINVALLTAAFLSLFGVAEFLYYIGKVKVEYTRKLVHIGTGLLTMLFPVMLGNHWLVLFLCGSFALIILASLQYHFLQSVNGIDRKSHGSIAYPIAVYGCFWVYDYYKVHGLGAHQPSLYFYLPILILALCDPIAALMGKAFPVGRYSISKDTKTVMGSMAFFVTAALISGCLLFFFASGAMKFPILISLSFVIALMATAAESLSGKGLDNLTIPATVELILIATA